MHKHIHRERERTLPIDQYNISVSLNPFLFAQSTEFHAKRLHKYYNISDRMVCVYVRIELDDGKLVLYWQELLGGANIFNCICVHHCWRRCSSCFGFMEWKRGKKKKECFYFHLLYFTIRIHTLTRHNWCRQRIFFFSFDFLWSLLK